MFRPQYAKDYSGRLYPHSGLHKFGTCMPLGGEWTVTSWSQIWALGEDRPCQGYDASWRQRLVIFSVREWITRRISRLLADYPTTLILLDDKLSWFPLQLLVPGTFANRLFLVGPAGSQWTPRSLKCTPISECTLSVNFAATSWLPLENIRHIVLR